MRGGREKEKPAWEVRVLTACPVLGVSLGSSVSESWREDSPPAPFPAPAAICFVHAIHVSILDPDMNVVVEKALFVDTETEYFVLSSQSQIHYN